MTDRTAPSITSYARVSSADQSDALRRAGA